MQTVYSRGTYYPGKNPQDIPSRIVSLAPASTEILFAIHAEKQIAARTDFCDYPPEAAAIPSVGGFDGSAFSIEHIISFSPDFVYLTSGMHDHLIRQLVSFGISVYVSDCPTIADIIEEILQIGKITGREQDALKTIESMTNQTAQIANNLALYQSQKKSPTVYVELSPKPFISVGKQSFIADIIRTAGGINLFDDIEQPYPQVSEESIIIRSPAHIFLLSDSPVTKKDILSRRQWKNIQAVAEENITVIDADILVRSGPRAVDAVRQVYSILYRDQK